MMYNRLPGAALIAASFYATGAGAQCANILSPLNGVPVVAPGWQAQLVANGLSRPRSLTFDSRGALLVLESGKGISRHRFTDDGGTCLSANHSHMLVERTTLNHGLALSNDGQTLFASSPESVFAWTYNSAGGSVSGDDRTLITNMSNNELVTRTLLVSRKTEGMLIVSRGSAATDMQAAKVVSSGLSQIRAFDLKNLTSTLNFTDGRVVGWGLRNSVGVAEHPVTGGLYAVENSIDGVTRNGVDIRQNNPGEELNFLGFANDTVVVSEEEEEATARRNYGYPECFAVWEPSEIPESEGLKVGDQFAVEENNTLTDEGCARDYVPPRLTFPAHYAPIDLEFAGDGGVAYVSFRGSFDRDDPAGYRVSSVAFDANRGEPVDASDSRTALVDIIYNKDNSACPDKCFRPGGLAIDGQGRIWMASDTTGEIYVLQRTGAATGTFVGGTSGAGRLGGGWEARTLGWGVAVAAGVLVALG